MNRNTALLVFLHFSSFPAAFLTTSFCNTFFCWREMICIHTKLFVTALLSAPQLFFFFQVDSLQRERIIDQSEVRLGFYVHTWDFILNKHRGLDSGLVYMKIYLPQAANKLLGRSLWFEKPFLRIWGISVCLYARKLLSWWIYSSLKACLLWNGPAPALSWVTSLNARLCSLPSSTSPFSHFFRCRYNLSHQKQEVS